MIANWCLIAFYAALIFNCAELFVAGQGEGLRCDQGDDSNCIDRPTYRIKAIVHGTSGDEFWQRTRKSSIQAGEDMRVKLDFELYDIFDSQEMADDITAATTEEFPPDALIVTIPDDVVGMAITRAAESIPIFGMNSGYKLSKSAGVLDFIAMDEHLGGVIAAKEFLKANNNITKALYINHSKGNIALEDRFSGLEEGFGPSVFVREVIVGDASDMHEKIAEALKGCEYEAIMVAGSDSSLDTTLNALESELCPTNRVHVGTFDVGAISYRAIASEKLLFAISQQEHLQGTLSVVTAATYATTEKKLSSSQAISGIYLSGPLIVNLDNLPSDSLQKCRNDAFPVCPNNKALDGISISPCQCEDRSMIRIAGVLHGITTDKFWDVVFAQAEQAADDLGVELLLDRLGEQPDAKTWHTKMSERIQSYCNDGVDGIFVSIPSPLVIEAIKKCQELNIPVISINAGEYEAETLELAHHISQLEKNAGFRAGKKMAEAGITSAFCLIHAANKTNLIDRCNGFEEGLEEARLEMGIDITYIGTKYVPIDMKVVYEREVQEFIGIEGDWDGIGVLILGSTTLEALNPVREQHSKLVVGTFDTNDEVFTQLNAGTLLFGIDQNPFMQGYMPVWLLTIMAHTKQQLQNRYIETGPIFVERSPSNALKFCERNDFEVCPRPVDIDLNQIASIRPIGLTLGGASMFLSLSLLGWVWYYRKAAVVCKSQPMFLGMICVGTFLMSATIIPLSIDDSIASEEGCTIACNSVPWLLWIGFIVTFSALFSKIYRIKRLIDSAKSFRRITISVWDVLPIFLILLTFTIIFLLIWSFVDPMYWRRQNVFGSLDDLNTYGSCVMGDTNVSTAMIACLTILAFAAVVMAGVAAWSGRAVGIEYSESRYVNMILVIMLQCFPIGIPLIILSQGNPTAIYFVETALIFVLTVSILLLIFVPKIGFLRVEQDQKKNPLNGYSRKSSTTSLRVMGTNTFEPRSSVIDPLAATIAINGVTTKQVEDLKQVLIKLDTIDDATDLQSHVREVGINISTMPKSTVREDGDEDEDEIQVSRICSIM